MTRDEAKVGEWFAEEVSIFRKGTTIDDDELVLESYPENTAQSTLNLICIEHNAYAVHKAEIERLRQENEDLKNNLYLHQVALATLQNQDVQIWTVADSNTKDKSREALEGGK